ncbi:preprotein translocase subunit YajC [Oxobacter pfennigii]|uniref:Preprotein translocase subunit YajC n=1 Tax=Oxobacter pfennigii TaxID=36849 RepID=A0A0N8NTJ3_9CLOT|nr:preprotein translocase subunit YajC [Oxobacter pfennigii]KPU44992.1 preprotein translocase subunit YajC [Oxobacter pfennigii]
MDQFLTQLLPWLVVMVIFYLLMIMPEQRKQKKFKSMIESLKVGDEVLTRSGIYGKIVNLQDDYFILESGAEKTRLKMTRGAIANLVNPTIEPEKK